MERWVVKLGVRRVIFTLVVAVVHRLTNRCFIVLQAIIISIYVFEQYFHVVKTFISMLFPNFQLLFESFSFEKLISPKLFFLHFQFWQFFFNVRYG